MRWTWVRIGSLTLLLAGCAVSPRLLVHDSPQPIELRTWSAATPLRPDENIRVEPVRRGEQASVHLVRIRDREQAHVHTRYDLVVLLVRGRGTLHLADRALPMRAGDAAFIPKRTLHFFVNEGRDDAAALVTFAPAFDRPDQQPAP